MSAAETEWFIDFFQGYSLDFWRIAVSPEDCKHEAAFLEAYLNIEHGARVLDVPCGNGRLAIPFAQLGYKVTALDLCKPYLEEGRRNDTSRSVEFLEQDMREVGMGGQFDAAYCMGNSLGYFAAADTCKFLHSVYGALKPGSHFILDTNMAAETFLVSGGEKEWVQVDDIYMLIENRYDVRQSMVETEYTFFRDGKQQKRTARHWVFTTGEICRMLESSGFEVMSLLGDIDGTRYEPGADRLLVLSRK